MTRGSRQRDALAPTLFPFLAVLLCTMGALVLILMLIVSGAQASKQQAAQETQLRVEEAETAIELVKHKLGEQLDEGQIQLEKERLKLQHLESHINELLAELDELKQAAELAEQELSADEAAEERLAAELSELEKKLAEATAEWQKKLDKPEGDKPVFAIIPYQGTNGTHRRPIYVECTADGVILQPEGVQIPMADLQPPYGPGNPLDAALRAIRAEFPPNNGAVTSTAYPLLVVRPNGIQAYVMARSAMRGWDDQFGYELIEQDLELAFPAATPGLKSKIASAIELARERQAALVMAMPQRYRGMNFDDSFDGQWRTGEGGGGGSAGSTTSGGDYAFAGGNGSEPSGTTGAPTAGSRGGLRSSESGMASTAGTGNSSFDTGSLLGVGQLGMTDAAGPWSGSETLSGSGAPLTAGGTTANGTNAEMLASDRSSRSGGGASWNDGNLSARDAGDPTGNTANTGWDTATGQPADSGRGEAGLQGSAGSSAGSTTGAFASNSSSSSASMSGDASGGSGAAGGSKPTAGAQPQMDASAQNAADASETRDPPSLTPSFNMNTQLNRSASRESTTPVAGTRGRNWAWSQGPPTETPVVRSIHLQCLQDRWVVHPDAGSTRAPVEIMFDGAPRERAEQLAKVVSERVQSWGIALMGGHWKPVLSVEVAPGAEWRYDQLRQLLDGSGLDVQRREPVTRP